MNRVHPRRRRPQTSSGCPLCRGLRLCVPVNAAPPTRVSPVVGPRRTARGTMFHTVPEQVLKQLQQARPVGGNRYVSFVSVGEGERPVFCVLRHHLPGIRDRVMERDRCCLLDVLSLASRSNTSSMMRSIRSSARSAVRSAPRRRSRGPVRGSRGRPKAGCEGRGSRCSRTPPSRSRSRCSSLVLLRDVGCSWRRRSRQPGYPGRPLTRVVYWNLRREELERLAVDDELLLGLYRLPGLQDSTVVCPRRFSCLFGEQLEVRTADDFLVSEPGSSRSRRGGYVRRLLARSRGRQSLEPAPSTRRSADVPCARRCRGGRCHHVDGRRRRRVGPEQSPTVRRRPRRSSGTPRRRRCLLDCPPSVRDFGRSSGRSVRARPQRPAELAVFNLFEAGYDPTNVLSINGSAPLAASSDNRSGARLGGSPRPRETTGRGAGRHGWQPRRRWGPVHETTSRYRPANGSCAGHRIGAGRFRARRIGSSASGIG